MAQTPKLQVTELDFDDIKNNLKTYMKNQTEFSDYNFEGSGLSHLIDLLAYNTHYMAMNANMAINEAFLDTATLRSSVVSHAKTLGYTPRSARAPVAYLDLTLNVTNRSSATLSKGTKFTTQVSGSSYGFVVNEDVTTIPSNGILRFSNIPVYEGTLVTTKYTVDSSDAEKRYIINDTRADTTTLKVSVQNSASDATTEVYELATDITQVTATSRSYFLQEVEDGKFEVYFGDDVIGKKLSDGNIVILEYIVTNMTEANGASRFSGTSIDGVTNITIATLVAARGGAEPESTESIRYNAPLDFASQGRAVTTEDYKLLVPQVYADAKSVQVWGGEDNDPPIYGQVYIAMKTNSGITLTQAQKDSIARSLDRYNVASVRPTFVDPNITKLRLTVNFKYDSKSTTKSTGDLETLVRTTISNYNSSDLDKFDVVFRHSKLTRLIDATDPSILSNITTVRMVNSFIPDLDETSKYTIKFNNKLHYPLESYISTSRPISHPTGVEVLDSTGFTISGYDDTMYLEDSGNGFIRMYFLTGGTTKTYVSNNVGTVNYETGEVVLESLTITGTSNSDGTIDIITKPESNDVVSVRNQLVEIDLQNTIVEGVNDTITSGGSSAGTNYSTSTSY
jgi:hypothetical protein